MKDHWIDVVRDVAELASLAVFLAMIGLVARAFGA
jgi:hypothetical protein